MRLFLLSPVLLTLLVLVACDQAPRLSPLGGDAVILAFGNSLTRGTGASADASYPSVLAELSGHEVVNAGVPGEESDAGLARLPAVLDAVSPALVILGHGGNDMLRQRDLEGTKANLRRMVELARERGASVVLLGVPKPALFPGTHRMYAELAEELDIPLEETALEEILADRALKSDQIHPNEDGYRALAEALHRLLRDSGAL